MVDMFSKRRRKRGRRAGATFINGLIWEPTKRKKEDAYASVTAKYGKEHQFIEVSIGPANNRSHGQGRKKQVPHRRLHGQLGRDQMENRTLAQANTSAKKKGGVV